MAGLRKRFNTQGITFEQFAFQYIVVLLGVYLAIFFEGKAEDRSRAAEAGAMLQSVVGELEFDEREISEALGGLLVQAEKKGRPEHSERPSC